MALARGGRAGKRPACTRQLPRALSLVPGGATCLAPASTGPTWTQHPEGTTEGGTPRTEPGATTTVPGGSGGPRPQGDPTRVLNHTHVALRGCSCCCFGRAQVSLIHSHTGPGTLQALARRRLQAPAALCTQRLSSPAQTCCAPAPRGRTGRVGTGEGCVCPSACARSQSVGTLLPRKRASDLPLESKWLSGDERGCGSHTADAASSRLSLRRPNAVRRPNRPTQGPHREAHSGGAEAQAREWSFHTEPLRASSATDGHRPGTSWGPARCSQVCPAAQALR